MLQPHMFVSTDICRAVQFSVVLPLLSALGADQIGAAPITCQRNVPALPSITSLT